MKPLTVLVPVLLALAACGGRTADVPTAPETAPATVVAEPAAPAEPIASAPVEAPAADAAEPAAAPDVPIAAPAEPEPVVAETAPGAPAAEAPAMVDFDAASDIPAVSVSEPKFENTIGAIAFTLFDGRATWGPTGFLDNGAETVWIGGELPKGGSPGDEQDGWTWVTADPAPVPGSAASHQSKLMDGVHQHLCALSMSPNFTPGATLYAWVYLDPKNPPKQVMLQWNQANDWQHRAIWGEDLIGWQGKIMGPLPALGQWVRLEVPASVVGLR